MSKHTAKRMSTMLMLTAMLLATTARAQNCPSWPTAERFAIHGAEVTDKRTGLTWRRCSEGQIWSGTTCTGSVTTHTHEAALTLAKAANPSQSASGWRLPNVKELASLADRGCKEPSIDSTAFPLTTSTFYWTSSPVPVASHRAWVVDFQTGTVGDGLSRSTFYVAVRLVRDSP